MSSTNNISSINHPEKLIVTRERSRQTIMENEFNRYLIKSGSYLIYGTLFGMLFGMGISRGKIR